MSKKRKKDNSKSLSKKKAKIKGNPTSGKYSVADYKTRIALFLQKADKKGLTPKQLAAFCKAEKGSYKNYKTALEELQKNAVVTKSKKMFMLSTVAGYFKAEIVRLNTTFGFAKKSDSDEEIFIPGKFLLGSLVGDTVLMKYIKSRSGNPEGEVVDILEFSNPLCSGTIILENQEKMLVCEKMCNTPIRIMTKRSVNFKVGDKVLAKISQRGKRHSEHKAEIVFSYGSAQKAENCAFALIDSEGLPYEFPFDVVDEAQSIAQKSITNEEIESRTDLRNEIIFTIDSAHSKDLDDAVSVKKTSSGYELGVHIADVSHYVKAGHPLDKEAMNRGTSVYFADKVIPMLPKELSNGICSLNPDEDRLAFSSLMKLDNDGKLIDFHFEKTVIRSRVKGVYKEINTILDGTSTPEIDEKYKDVRETIFLLNELADLRLIIRANRGTPQIETVESEFIIDENGVCSDVVPRTRGKSEQIIEEMMLLANESAAKTARNFELPFVYRVHETPSDEKINILSETLIKLNIPLPRIGDTVKPAHLKQILENAKESSSYPIINNLVLRSMPKAKYSDKPLGHFGLALEDYSHFTSPIRRYSDLAIHRILTAFLIKQQENGIISKKLYKFAPQAADAATEAELRAVAIERKCEDFYKAEYMSSKIGEKYTGLITSVTDYGFYVLLENSVEGLVRINSLPDGNYDIDEGIAIIETTTNKTYAVGDKVEVICSKAAVEIGKIDFDLV
jgi:ribonuclease R